MHLGAVRELLKVLALVRRDASLHRAAAKELQGEERKARKHRI
jgi:hypothetical protein